jgi:hypothetical protein
MFVKKTGGSTPQGFVNVTQDRTTFDTFVKVLNHLLHAGECVVA